MEATAAKCDQAGITIQVTPHRPEPQEWDKATTMAGLPAFYRSWFIAAYESQPLLTTIDMCYLTAYANDGAIAILPLYLVPATDPFGIEPASPGDTWAISHFWHCNDTHLPATALSQELVAAMWLAIGQQAAAWQASKFGMVNLEADGPLSRYLATTGATRGSRGDRYRIDSTGIRTFDDHLARLPRSVRQDARRQIRKANGAGIASRVYRPPLPDLVVRRVCELMEITGRRYNPGFYDGGRIERLITGAGPELCILTLESGQAVVAASISFLCGTTLHNWAIGAEPALLELCSPFTVLLKLSAELAADHHCRWIELGRINGPWKCRMGAVPVPLESWMSTPARAGQLRQ
ncbi:MAG TPA: GNAT family N-acetyltransferase [Streptosporangiaceae bacterium]|nr:GNAT family N-acetyltransferase [Streptosporangiaceae bacterium]